MQKWEYFGFYYINERGLRPEQGWELDREWENISIAEAVRRLGDEGWELVCVAGQYANHFYFRRPKQ